MQTGRVKWFDPSRGYGFIIPDNGDEDAFVHVHDLQRSGLDSLVQGARVSFELGTDRRTGRVRATRVQVE